MQVLTGLGVLLLLLAVFKLFPILSWIVLAIIGVHLLLAWSRRLEVSEDVLFLEWMVAILATLPLNGFGNTSHVIVFFSILFGGVYWILQNLEEEEEGEGEEEELSTLRTLSHVPSPQEVPGLRALSPPPPLTTCRGVSPALVTRHTRDNTRANRNNNTNNSHNSQAGGQGRRPSPRLSIPG